MAFVIYTPCSTPAIRKVLSMSPIKKPAKPHPDFPLYAHAGKVWAKKILGKLWYFGPWDDPQAALEKYLAQKDAILAGRDPRKLAGVVGVDSGDGCKVRLLVNSLLNAKPARMESGQLSRKMFTQYHDACSIIVEQFGKESQVAALKPADFSACLAALPKTWGLEMIGGTVGRIRSVFKFGSVEQLVDRPVKENVGEENVRNVGEVGTLGTQLDI